MTRVTATEQDGLITIRIPVAVYGDTGLHWREVLGGSRRAEFGRIYLQRFGAATRRKYATYPLRGVYSGDPADLDECPGAMYIWTGRVPADVEAVFAHHNRALGKHMELALRQFPQASEADLWEVEFEFR